MTIRDKEILVSELEEHLSQVLESSHCIGNPFIIIPHPVLYSAVYDSFPAVYEQNLSIHTKEILVTRRLDMLMRVIVDLK